MKYILRTLLFLFIPGILAGQSIQPDWKNIFEKNKFTVLKDKNAIPKDIMMQITDTISNILNPGEKWDATCHSVNLPHIRLNWAATDGTNWVVCYTSGGYGVKTFYYLFSGNFVESYYHSSWDCEIFKNFKRKFISETLETKASIRKY